MGIEPTRPNGHMALNHACLPVPAPRCVVSLNQKVKRYARLSFGDLAGARTQDHLLKREVLYQLSYQVIKNLAGLSPAENTNKSFRVCGCKYNIILFINQSKTTENFI